MAFEKSWVAFVDFAAPVFAAVAAVCFLIVIAAEKVSDVRKRHRSARARI